MDDEQSIEAADGLEIQASLDPGSLALDAKGMELFKRGQALAQKLARIQMRKLPTHMDFDDVHQAALIGLAQASARYDSSSSTASFETFAHPRINGGMLDFIRKESALTRSNVAFQSLVNRAKNQLLSDKLDRVTDSDIAEKIGMAPEEYSRRASKVELNYASSQFKSLCAESDDGEEFQADAIDEGSNTFDIVSQRQRVKIFLVFKNTKLTEREQLFIDMVYEGRLLKEIGGAFGFTESRACQIMGGIQERLEAFMAVKFGEASVRPSRPSDGADFQCDASTSDDTASQSPIAAAKIENLADKLSVNRHARSTPLHPLEAETGEDGKIIVKQNTRWG